MEAEKFQLRQNNISNGFTLLETIFVLGILSLFLVLAIPLSWTFLQKQQEKQFIDTLQSDLLLIQSLSAQEDDQIKIIFHETDYTVQTSRAKKETQRAYPPGWMHPPRLYTTISFSDGQVREPGTIKFKINDAKELKFVFPLGKGRGYFAE
ncbi:competence type IV pilus minor pilin ComGD [Virgibacillus halophilus]|uniref:competence type IV pilus minor pilin ComGD n=1 Tax=Tigheibacillus halophilus TaxID=361280 RepID=UPI00363E6354